MCVLLKHFKIKWVPLDTGKLISWIPNIYPEWKEIPSITDLKVSCSVLSHHQSHSPVQAGKIYPGPWRRSPVRWAGSPSPEQSLQPSLPVPSGDRPSPLSSNWVAAGVSDSYREARQTRSAPVVERSLPTMTPCTTLHLTPPKATWCLMLAGDLWRDFWNDQRRNFVPRGYR